MKKYVYPSVDETMYEHVFENGLKIAILPKPGFSKTEVNLAVKFGSLHESVLLKDSIDPITFPAGVAHFIEHLLFESDESNPTAAFARIGASVNAYTTYDRTNYYFSTTNEPSSGIKLLINMVLKTKFTKKSVEKESMIITQEITMYEDDYEQLIYNDFMQKMYRNHPITRDIAGTVKSVSETTYETLNQVYQLFYHPSNMVMVIVGDVDVEALIHLIETELKQFPKRPSLIEKQLLKEDEFIRNQSPEFKHKELSIPMLMMGVRLKLDALSTMQEQLLDDVKLSFLLTGIFGKGAKPYHDLMKKRLINDSFDYFESFEKTYGHIILFTETKKVETTRLALTEVFNNIMVEKPDLLQFSLSKRKIIGEYLQIFNNISHLGNSFLEYYLKDVNMFEFYQSLESISYEDVLSIRDKIDLSTLMTLVYLPKDD